MTEKFIDEAEFERQFEAAKERGKKRSRVELRAKNVTFDMKSGSLVIDLFKGVRIEIPTQSFIELDGADPKLIAEVVLSPSGNALHWKALNVDFSLGAAISDALGKEVLAEYGRLGGSVSSEAKAMAARKNGIKGGRPRKPWIHEATFRFDYDFDAGRSFVNHPEAFISPDIRSSARSSVAKLAKLSNYLMEPIPTNCIQGLSVPPCRFENRVVSPPLEN